MNPFASPESLTGFLSQYLPVIEHVSFLAQGLNCHVYAFTSQGRACVLRVAYHPIHTHKEALAYRLLGAALPIPMVLAQGTGPGYSWVIVQRCGGQNLAQTEPPIPPKTVVSMVVGLAMCLHRQPIPLGSAVGMWQNEPAAAHWSEYIGHCHGFIWRQQRGSLLKQNLFEDLCRQIRHGLKDCPEQVWLIHGDFKPANLMLDRQEITGVIDWAGLGTGDFLYDLASFGLYGDIDADWLLAPYRRDGFDLKQAASRWRTYTLHHLLGALWTLSQHNLPQEFWPLQAQASALLNERI